jgi:uncharacterized protein YdaU (DUF1376 family)
MRNNWPVRLNPEGWTTKQLEAALKSMKEDEAKKRGKVDAEQQDNNKTDKEESKDETQVTKETPVSDEPE